MGIKVQRSTYKLGTSKAITLPADWCRYYRGRINKVTIYGSTLLVIAPEGLERQAEELAEMMESHQPTKYRRYKDVHK